ncbi:hypothetical protein [Georgenia sp. AZ-5]|uniref:hypothetical protein n=1 Tax=Georgenia sp. AZ-5 TaxID=3367526 RepID=UPI00375464A4
MGYQSARPRRPGTGRRLGRALPAARQHQLLLNVEELLGLSTRGTFEAHTIAMSLASIVSLALALVLSAVM